MREDLDTLDLSTSVEKIEYFFHLSAQPGVRASWGKNFTTYVKNNISVTQKILESLKNNNTLKKFIFASSSSVYGNQSNMMNEDTTLTKPVSPYGVTKLAAENLVNLYFKNYDIPTISLRYFTVYGPKQRPDMAFTRFFYSIIKEQKLTMFGNGEQTRDFTYVDDVVSGIYKSLKLKGYNVLNFGNNKPVSINYLIGKISELSGKKTKINKKPLRPEDVFYTCANITKTKKLIGWTPKTNIDQGLTKTFNWHLENQKWLKKIKIY